MTQPLDPYTLRQAANNWPDATLSKRAAQSFLHTLADTWEKVERDQPATAVDPVAELAQRLHDAACGCLDQQAGRSSYWLTIARAAVAELRP